MITTPDDLLRLAPDAKTLEAGRRLFYSKRWRLVGGDGQWLWGEFVFGPDLTGKGTETAVELTTGRYVCTCRARQRPCAHGLALVLMLKNDQQRITVGQPPSWVRSVQHRATPPVAKPSRPETVSPATVARLDLMTEGISELEVRLLDIARRGIADTLAQGPEPFLAAAARLTDAKLPGPAAQFRRLANLGPDGTEAEVARTLGNLYLFVRTWRNRADLQPKQVDELYQFAGLSTKKEELLGRPGLKDHWLVMGVVNGQEDKLRYRRVWLRGEQSRRFALLMDYAFGERPFERSWPTAAAFDGSVHYYPGSYPQRGVFPQPMPGGRPYDGLVGYDSFAALRGNYQKALAFNPWLYTYPAYLVGVRPLRQRQAYYLVDASGEPLPLPRDFTDYYRLLAVLETDGLSLFAEYDGYCLRPLTLVTGAGLVAL